MTSLTPGAVLSAASRHRGVLAAGLAAAAVATGIGVVAPAPPDSVTILSAARDLPGGSVLTASDLHRVALPRETAPDGALTETSLVEGRLLAGPVRRGEALTDARLVGAGLLRGQPSELRAVTLRLADPAATAVLRAGDHVDVLAAATAEGAALGRAAVLVAADVAVLAVPILADDSGEGALVVVAALPDTAARLAGAAVTSRLSAVVRPVDAAA